MDKGIDLIAAERQRQIDVEGWTQEHDQKHNDFQLSGAAICYAYEAGCTQTYKPRPRIDRLITDLWPFGYNWWRPSSLSSGVIKKEHSIRMLVKAGALIAAEIDRLQNEGE